MRAHHLFTGAAAAALLLGVTACGGGTTPAAAPVTPDASTTAPTTDASSPSAPVSSATDTTTGTTSTGSLDVCTALPPTDLNRIVGAHFTQAKASSVGDSIYSCEYSDGNANLLNVTVSPTNGDLLYQTDFSVLTQAGFPPKKLTGVGDEAFSMPDPQGSAGSVGASSFASFGEVFGDVYVKIGGSPYVDAARGAQIADQVHAAM